MTNLELLKALRLGFSVAEEERKELSGYFVRTDAWDRLIRGDVDVVYGGKGAGKSALYLLLLDQAEEMRTERRIHLIAGENPSEDPVFKSLDDRSDISEQEFVTIWKLYVLSLLGNYIREHVNNDAAQPILKRLEAAGLIPAEGLGRVLKVAMRYLSAVKATADTGDVKYTISIGEPTIEEEEKGVVSAQTLLRDIDKLLQAENISVWILFDRLDVAFTRPDSETPALRALFRVYRDMSGLERLKLKIFLRNDIWDRITRTEGFRESSHVVKVLTINWNPEALRHLVLSRFFATPAFAERAGIDRETALSRGHLQTSTMGIIFPPQVESGPKKSETFDWIIKRVIDGQGNVAPREIIHLVTAARDEQIRIDETGGTGSTSLALLSPNALKLAHDEVSQRKVETLYSEHPHLRPYIEVFKGMKTEHILETIVALFASRGLDGDPFVPIKELVEIGFLQERRASGGETTYWVPFIFRPYLAMSQGASFDKEKIIPFEE